MSGLFSLVSGRKVGRRVVFVLIRWVGWFERRVFF